MTLPHVEIQTNYGNIQLELEVGHAPHTCANFLEYVNAGYYSGLLFHRVMPRFVIQGGAYRQHPDTSLYVPQEPRASIPFEVSGLHNIKYSVAMARRILPHTANSQFFINLANNQKNLDHQSTENNRDWGYCVFGSVSDGFDVVDAIAQVPTSMVKSRHDDVPINPVIIHSIKLIESTQ